MNPEVHAEGPECDGVCIEWETLCANSKLLQIPPRSWR